LLSAGFKCLALVRAAGIEIEVVVALNYSRAAGTQAMLGYIRTFGCPDSLYCDGHVKSVHLASLLATNASGYFYNFTMRGS